MSRQFPLFSFVVPCFNEASRFSLLTEAFEDFDKEWEDAYELILIDDGSSDQTFEVMNNWSQKAPLKNGKILCLSLGKNCGKGRALMEGVMKAKGDWILTLDADMATRPHQLITWFDAGLKLKSKTVYIGSRVHPEAEVEAKWIRRVTGEIYNMVTRLFTPIKESDTQCGYKLYPSKLGKVVFQKLKTPGWAHDIEILSRVVKEGGNVKSLPVFWVHQEGAKINVLKDGIKMFLETMKIGKMIRKEYKR